MWDASGPYLSHGPSILSYKMAIFLKKGFNVVFQMKKVFATLVMFCSTNRAFSQRTLRKNDQDWAVGGKRPFLDQRRCHSAVTR